MHSTDPRVVVVRYLDALAAHDWEELAATLAADVVRFGPYGDVYRGAGDYSTFLRGTVEALSGYELAVERVLVAGTTVVAELHETVDDGGGRLRTREAVVFDVGNGKITRVAVYLQASAHL